MLPDSSTLLVYHFRWLDKYLNGVELQTIKRDMLDKISVAKQTEGVENSTVNRVMEVVRIILRKACNEWEWLDRVPAVLNGCASSLGKRLTR